jgi:hypothetical protein
VNDNEMKAFLEQATENAAFDAMHALQLNDDAKYWAACGRKSAYLHVLQVIEERAKP